MSLIRRPAYPVVLRDAERITELGHIKAELKRRIIELDELCNDITEHSKFYRDLKQIQHALIRMNGTLERVLSSEAGQVRIRGIAREINSALFNIKEKTNEFREETNMSELDTLLDELGAEVSELGRLIATGQLRV